MTVESFCLVDENVVVFQDGLQQYNNQNLTKLANNFKNNTINGKHILCTCPIYRFTLAHRKILVLTYDFINEIVSLKQYMTFLSIEI